MALNILPQNSLPMPTELPIQRDERNLSDPSEGKGFIMHNVRDFIQEMTKGLFNWSEKNSIWPLTFGIKCCAIEMMAFGASRYDSDRLGVFFRASPRQADLMIVAGPATIKLKEVILRLYEQMPEPKYVIAFGECSICGGPFWDSYSVINGVDKLIPVDVYVPGCPPRPEQLLLAIQKLQEIIDERNGRKGTTVVGVPERSREELLAEVMAHPTFAIGHQSNQPRFQPTPEELALATATGQPASVIEAIKKKSAAAQPSQSGTTTSQVQSSAVQSNPPTPLTPTSIPSKSTTTQPVETEVKQ
jgi:NADH-quinone oxidoreductase subunit B